MDAKNNGISCVMGCWLAALAAGIVLAILLMFVGDFRFTSAAFWGLLLFVLAGALLAMFFCKGEVAQTTGVAAASAAGAVASSASTSEAVASADVAAVAPQVSGGVDDAVAAPVAKAANVSSGVKSGTILSGEDELAGRKGEWKYEPEAVAKPKKAAPKPAAQKPAKAAATKSTKSAAKPVAKDGKPELLKNARAGGPDDLKQIKGVGPKMEGMLHKMGVFHFDQVSSWRKAEVQWVDDNLEGFKGRVSRDEWVKQAKILAKGGTTKFSKKVDKGGVY